MGQPVSLCTHQPLADPAAPPTTSRSWGMDEAADPSLPKKTESASALHAQPSTTCRTSMRYTRVKTHKKLSRTRSCDRGTREVHKEMVRKRCERGAKEVRKRCTRGAQEVHKRCVPHRPASLALHTPAFGGPSSTTHYLHVSGPPVRHLLGTSSAPLRHHPSAPPRHLFGTSSAPLRHLPFGTSSAPLRHPRFVV